MATDTDVSIMAASSRLEETSGRNRRPSREDLSNELEFPWSRDVSAPVISYGAGHTVRIDGDFQFAKVDFGFEVASRHQDSALNWIRSAVTYLRERAVAEIRGQAVSAVALPPRPEHVSGIIFWLDLGLTLKDVNTGVYNKGNLSIRTPIPDAQVDATVSMVIDRAQAYMRQEHPWLTGRGISPVTLAEAGL